MEASGNFLETSGKFVEGCGKLWKLLEGSGMSAAVPDTASYVRGRSESNEGETMVAGSRPSTSKHDSSTRYTTSPPASSKYPPTVRHTGPYDSYRYYSGLINRRVRAPLPIVDPHNLLCFDLMFFGRQRVLPGVEKPRVHCRGQLLHIFIR